MNDELLESRRYFLSNDANFNELYPYRIQKLASLHWTPLHITNLAANFLATSPCKILDIGSGVGKFCLAGGCYAPNAHFYGVELRNNLIQHAEKAQKKLGVDNVTFIHKSFTELDLRTYDHFYFYNSFQEHLEDEDRIDESIEYSDEQYAYYVRQLYAGLQKMPKGTKVVTYHASQGEIPSGYENIESYQNGELNFWLKK